MPARSQHALLPPQQRDQCPLFNTKCTALAYFGIGRHGKEKAWQLAVDKVRELNPRGDIARGRTVPTLKNLSGRQQEQSHDL